MPTTERASRGGFTLVEMLVVVGIILLVVTLSLPSIISARRSSQVAVGTAQMKSLNDMLTSMALDHKGRMLTPVDHIGGADSNLTQGFGYLKESRFTGEGFAVYWVSYLLAGDPTGGIKPEMGVSPADGELQHALDGVKAGNYLIPGSFYYSPTMFSSWHEYDFTGKDGGCCPSQYGPMYRGDCCDPKNNCAKVACGVGAAFLQEITFPDSKVVLYERADFMQTSRAQTGGNGKPQNRSLSPAWNNPKARPHVALADGSVAIANMSVLTQAASASMNENTTLDMVPVDLFAAPDTFPAVQPNGCAAMDIDPTSADGLLPYFFAGTRYGAHGRDLVPDARK